MNDDYIEYMIKRKNTAVGWILRILSIVFVIVCVFLFNVFKVFALLAGILAAYLVRYTFQTTSVEYEYIFFGGQCQFDKIMSKRKRKGCGKMEMEKVEIIAPEGSQELKGYDNKDYRTRKFISGNKDAIRYVAFERKDSELIKIIFEPNDKLIKAMQSSSPSKVILDKR